jgi:hypothetical protein
LKTNATMTIAIENSANPLRLLSLVLFGSAIACASVASAETLRVGKAVPKSFSFSLIDLGEKRGIFKADGLELEITSFGGGARLQQALAAKSIDIGFGGGVDMAFIVVDIGAEVTGTERSLNDRIYDAQMSILSADGRFRPAALDAIRRSFVDLKILEREPDMATLYTEKFLPR